MRAVKCLLAVLILGFPGSFAGVYASETERLTLDRFESLERAGERHYREGEYERAFALLSQSAESGLKLSQYLLAIMYLKGQYVEQAIDTGMAWLGVANEVEVREWQAQYEGIYAQLNDAQKALIDKKVAHYVERYGMEVQGVACENRSTLGSRKLKLECLHRDRTPRIITGH